MVLKSHILRKAGCKKKRAPVAITGALSVKITVQELDLQTTLLVRTVF
jgi:hypothetical protein